MFFAPEMFQLQEKGEIQGKKTDIWALGITLFYLLCGKYPFEEAKNPLYLKDLILEKEINFEWINHSPARELVKKMLERNPEKRATLDEIIND